MKAWYQSFNVFDQHAHAQSKLSTHLYVKTVMASMLYGGFIFLVKHTTQRRMLNLRVRAVWNSLSLVAGVSL